MNEWMDENKLRISRNYISFITLHLFNSKFLESIFRSRKAMMLKHMKCITHVKKINVRIQANYPSNKKN